MTEEQKALIIEYYQNGTEHQKTLVSEFIRKILDKGSIIKPEYFVDFKKFGKVDAELKDFIREKFDFYKGKIKTILEIESEKNILETEQKKGEFHLELEGGTAIDEELFRHSLYGDKITEIFDNRMKVVNERREKTKELKEINFEEIFGEEIIKKANEIVEPSTDLIYSGKYFEMIKGAISLGKKSLFEIRADVVEVSDNIFKDSKIKELNKKYHFNCKFLGENYAKFSPWNLGIVMTAINNEYKNDYEKEEGKILAYTIAKFFYERNRILKMLDREIEKTNKNQETKEISYKEIGIKFEDGNLYIPENFDYSQNVLISKAFFRSGQENLKI